MVATMALSGSVILKAGVGVHADIASGVVDIDGFITQAESLCCAISRYDWIANYGTVETNLKDFLREVIEDIAAIYCITYDMAGYTSRIEAEDIINVLRDAALRGLSILRDQKGVKFIKDGA